VFAVVLVFGEPSAAQPAGGLDAFIKVLRLSPAELDAAVLVVQHQQPIRWPSR
jgi:hypothetical protein